MPWLSTNSELSFDSSVDANAYCNNIVHDGPFFQQGASLNFGSADDKEIRLTKTLKLWLSNSWKIWHIIKAWLGWNICYSLPF
jgi:hypothetical protein